MNPVYSRIELICCESDAAPGNFSILHRYIVLSEVTAVTSSQVPSVIGHPRARYKTISCIRPGSGQLGGHRTLYPMIVDTKNIAVRTMKGRACSIFGVSRWQRPPFSIFFCPSLFFWHVSVFSAFSRHTDFRELNQRADRVQIIKPSCEHLSVSVRTANSLLCCIISIPTFAMNVSLTTIVSVFP